MTIKPKPYEPDYAVHPGATLLECIIFSFAYELITKKPFLEWDGLNDNQNPDEVHDLMTQLITIIQAQAPLTETLINQLPQGFPPKTFWQNYQKNYEKDLARLKK